MTDINADVGDDILCGARAIGLFLLPKIDGGRVRTEKQLQRAIFHLAAHTNLPVFKIGSRLCARKTVVIEWIKAEESKRASSVTRSRRGSSFRTLCGT
jgi:hypothetical protein